MARRQRRPSSRLVFFLLLSLFMRNISTASQPSTAINDKLD